MDLPVTGVVDEDVMKIVNAGTCPLKGKKPQKQELKVLPQQAESGNDATLSTKNLCYSV